MTYNECIDEVNDDPGFIRKYYENASEVVGIEFAYTNVHIGFVCGDSARAVSFDRTHSNNWLIADYDDDKNLKQVYSLAKEWVGTNVEHAVIGIPHDYAEHWIRCELESCRRAGFTDAHFAYNTIAAAIGAYWDGAHTADKTVAACVFRGDSFGDTTYFGVSIIEIKDGVFYVKGMSRKPQTFHDRVLDNRIIKEICLTTIREIDLKHVDEVLIVGRSYYVTYQKPLIKAVRRRFRRLFEGECKYTRGNENLIAKGLAVYGRSLLNRSPIIVEDLPEKLEN